MGDYSHDRRRGISDKGREMNKVLQRLIALKAEMGEDSATDLAEYAVESLVHAEEKLALIEKFLTEYEDYSALLYKDGSKFAADAPKLHYANGDSVIEAIENFYKLAKGDSDE
jgi:hypothetical protein